MNMKNVEYTLRSERFNNEASYKTSQNKKYTFIYKILVRSLNIP